MLNIQLKAKPAHPVALLFKKHLDRVIQSGSKDANQLQQRKKRGLMLSVVKVDSVWHGRVKSPREEDWQTVVKATTRDEALQAVQKYCLG